MCAEEGRSLVLVVVDTLHAYYMTLSFSLDYYDLKKNRSYE